MRQVGALNPNYVVRSIFHEAESPTLAHFPHSVEPTPFSYTLHSAEEFISSGGSPAQGSEVREGLGGLLDRAKGEVQSATNVVVDVVTAPLQLLIDAAQVVLEAVQSVVDATRESLDSIDQSRCT